MGGFFGSFPSGTGGRVALQILASGWEVSVELRRHTFRRWPLPFPRVGELASPGPRSFSRRGAWVSAAKGGSRAELPAARKAARASGGFLETLKQRVCFAPPSGRKGSFGILARAREEPYALEEVSPPRGRQDRTSESRFEGMAGPTG